MIREIREKLEGLQYALMRGDPNDYPAYRELVGRVSVLRELDAFYREQSLVGEQDNDDNDDGAPT